MIQSHGMKLIMLGRKIHIGAFKTKESRAGLVPVSSFWKSHCLPCEGGKFLKKLSCCVSRSITR